MMEHGGWSALGALTAREMRRFVRQPSRIVAALGTPAIMWVLFGSGFAGTFAHAEGDSPYAAYLLPGMITMAVLFSSIFAAISLIEDRHAGFLQSVLASPAPRWALVGSKVAGGTIVATAQGALLLLLAPVVGMPLGVTSFLLAVGAIVCVSTLVNGIGLAAAWWIDSSQGFHGVMNLVLMPMWLLSGSLFPVGGAASWLRLVMLANPLYWPTAALRHSVSPRVGAEPFAAGPVWIGALAVAGGAFVLAWMMVGRIRRA